MRPLVGRDDELAALSELLAVPERLPGTAVLAGDAGIGKTSVLLAGSEEASERGFRMLSTRPSEAETGYSYGGLADLLGDAVGDIVPALPVVQRRALETALLIGDAQLHVDDRAVVAAFLASLRHLAIERPVCLAVDDVQWLDAASASALRYALARVRDAPIAALVAVRGSPPEWLRRAVPEDRLLIVEIGGLSLGAIHELLRIRLDATFARPTLIRIWETSRGNPFFALELAAALQRRGGKLAPGEELPIPSDLDELLRTRLRGLGASALDAARVVAALADPTVELAEAALGSRADPGLAEAIDAGILELDGKRLRLTHPLLAAAVVARQTPARRRALNARLAGVVPSFEERARHLALATAEPDADVASILEDAARAAQDRGAPTTAAELAEQSLRLTPASSAENARRRVLLAADLHFHAGDSDRATVLLEQARAAAAPGRQRATVLTRLAEIQPSPEAAIATYLTALAETDDDGLQATIHLQLASWMRFADGVDAGLEHGRLAVLAASRVDDAALRCRALAAHALLHFNSGRGIPETMDEARALERSLPGWPIGYGPTQVFAHQLMWSGEIDRARSLLHELRSAFAARVDPLEEADTLWYLSLVEWRAGNWEEAEGHAADSLDLTAQLGRRMPPDDYPMAIVAAHRGRPGDARARAELAVAHGEAEDIAIVRAGYSWVLGFVELSLGDAALALPHLRRAASERDATGGIEPGMRVEQGDLLETLINVGELEEADEVLGAAGGGRSGA
jgi:tetratricopeptide (TPR) repeat protein